LDGLSALPSVGSCGDNQNDCGSLVWTHRNGRTNANEKLGSPSAALAEHDKLIAEKLRKGSVEKKRAAEKSAAKQQPGKKQASSNALIERLDRWLRAKRPKFVKHLKPGAKPVRIAALEKKIGSELPPGLRALLAWHDGQELGARFQGNRYRTRSAPRPSRIATR
jgi:hypothetical protein